MKKICSRFDYTGKLKHGSAVDRTDLELNIKILQVLQMMLWVRVLFGV